MRRGDSRALRLVDGALRLVAGSIEQPENKPDDGHDHDQRAEDANEGDGDPVLFTPASGVTRATTTAARAPTTRGFRSSRLRSSPSRRNTARRPVGRRSVGCRCNRESWGRRLQAARWRVAVAEPRRSPFVRWSTSAASARLIVGVPGAGST